ncbi:MAG: c-type cytochrome domain-containing protein [Pirellulaceae bacterium]
MVKICVVISFVCSAAGSSRAAEAQPISFRSDIAPILLDNCLACHGAKLAEGGFRVDSYQELLKAGDSGETPIATASDQTSELLRRLDCDVSERMPAEAEPLTAEQIDRIKQWIVAGATFDGSDPAQPLHLVIPPATHPAAPETYVHPVPIVASRFSPDGAQIIAGGYHELTVWNVADGSLQRRIGNVGQRVFAIDFSADGQTMAVACGEPGRSGEVRLIDMASGQIQGVVARASDVAYDVAFRPGSDEIAVAMADSSIRIINVTDQTELRNIASHADWVSTVAWNEDGSRLVSASRDKTSKVFDGATGDLLASYAGHGAPVRAAVFSADGTHVLSAGDDKILHRWQVDDGKKVVGIPLGTQPGKIARSGNNLFVPCADHRLLRIDLSENKVAQTYAGHSDWVLTAQVQPSENAEAAVEDNPTAERRATLQVEDNPTAERRATLQEQPSENASPTDYLLSSSFDGQLRLWNMADGTSIRTWQAKP